MADSKQYRTKFYVQSVVFLVLVLAILLLLNLTSDETSRLKVDLSRDQLYSISDATVSILGDLKDEIKVTYYYNEAMGSMRPNLLRDTRDMFDEFRQLSGGNFTYQVIDPEEEAAKYALAKTVEYFKKRREWEDSGKKGDPPAEPKRPVPIFEMFGRNQPTDDQIREQRQKEAAARARATNRTREEVERELVSSAYKDERLGSLEQEGIRAYTFMERKGDSARQVKIYSAIRIDYLAKQPEVLPIHQNLEGLEYELAHRIVKLTMPKKPVVAFFDARKPPPPPPPANPMERMQPPVSDYAVITNHLGQLFDMRQIDLKKDDSIDGLVKRLKEDKAREEGSDKESDEEEKDDAEVTADDVREFISCLVVAQPDNLEDRQVYEINRAVSLGVPTIFFVSPYSMDISPQGMAQNVPLSVLRTGLDEVFRKWGIELGGEILASNDSGGIPVQQMVNLGGMRIPVQSFANLAAIVAPKSQAISQEHPLTMNIGQLAFPATAGFKTMESVLEDNELRATVLAWAPQETWSQPVNPFEGANNPMRRGQPLGVQVLAKRDLILPKDPETFRDFLDDSPALAVYLEGRFPFHFEGQTIPEWKPEEKPDKDNDDRDSDLLPNPVDAVALSATGLPQAEGTEAGKSDPAPDAEAGKEAAPATDTEASKASGEAGEKAEEPTGTKEPEQKPEAPKEPEKPKAHIEPSESGKVILLASTDILKNDFVRLYRQFDGYENNVRFIQSAVELFGLDPRLLNIRRKTLTIREFDRGTEAYVWPIQLINILGIPGIVVLIALVRFLWRQSESIRYERRYVG